MAIPLAADASGAWSVVIPVKRLLLAKSRILLPDEQRIELAIAMARDTIGSIVECSAVGDVVIVTDDPRIVSELSNLSIRVVGDEPDDGLNAALVHGIRHIRHDRVALVSSDLPALRPGDLGAVLAEASRFSSAVVADAAGSGTTVLASRNRDIQPQFGPDSLTAHVAAGAVDITSSAAAGVRLDVDTLAALEDASQLGVGAATSAVVAGWNR